MFTEERQNLILKRLKNEGRVEVSVLADKFSLSVDTIRRDLKSLEARGLLRRTHGGAISRGKSGPQPDLKERTLHNREIKEKIALRGAAMIEKGDSLLLDGSSSVLAIIPHLSSIDDLSIYTSSPNLACAVMDNCPRARLELIGGILQKGSDNGNGSLTVHTIEGLKVDKVVMGVCGLSRQGRLSSFNPDEAPVQAAMLEAGERILLLMDGSKWGETYLKDLGEIPPNCTLISDETLPSETASTLSQILGREPDIIIEK